MERAEFEKIILPLSRKLYRFTYRFLSNGEDAEDAVQEVCIKLWNMKNKLHQYRSIEALAMTMTRNHCLDRLRKRGREIFEDTRPIDTRTDGMDPQTEIENTEDYRNILKIVSDLPDKYRIVIELRDINGHSYEEIEKELGENLNTIRVNLSRARKMVREKLIKLNYEPARTG
jgi:RNA polymerase sigma factor (sigma-70 family)